MIATGSTEILASHQAEIYRKTGELVEVYPHIDLIPPPLVDQVEILVTYGNYLTDGEPKLLNISRFPKLSWIQLLSVGLEGLPLDEIKQLGIIVTNVAGIQVTPMSEWVLACMLYFEKDLGRYFAQKQEHRYDRSKWVGEIAGREVLIYGTGTISQAVARLLTVLNARVFGVNTTGRPVDPFVKTFTLAQARQKICTADFVVSLLPSTPNTQGLFDREYLNLMKEDAIFISLGRGDVVDEDSVVQLVKEGKLRGAAFDVFKQEPLSPFSPLWDCPNLILTPHMSAKSIYYVDRCVEIFIKNLLARRNGQPMINMVNIAKGY